MKIAPYSFLNSKVLHMKMSQLKFGCEPKQFDRDWRFYVDVQIIIFVKVIIFFWLFGHGISYAVQPLAYAIPFAAIPVFGNSIHVMEWVFHQIMHVLIFLWVFLLARHVKKIKIMEIAGLFVAANVLHNVGYWITYTHPTVLFSIRDFFTDYIALWVFFGFFMGALHFFPSLRKWKMGLIEEKI